MSKESREKSTNLGKFSSRLRKARIDSGLSREQFAKKINIVGLTQVSRYETGKAFPAIDILKTITEILGVDLHWLITGNAAPDTAALAKALKKPAEKHLESISQQIRQLSNDMVALDLARIFKGSKTKGKINETQRKIDELKSQYELLSRILASSFELDVKIEETIKK